MKTVKIQFALTISEDDAKFVLKIVELTRYMTNEQKQEILDFARFLNKDKSA